MEVEAREKAKCASSEFETLREKQRWLLCEPTARYYTALCKIYRWGRGRRKGANFLSAKRNIVLGLFKKCVDVRKLLDRLSETREIFVCNIL